MITVRSLRQPIRLSHIGESFILTVHKSMKLYVPIKKVIWVGGLEIASVQLCLLIHFTKRTFKLCNLTNTSLLFSSRLVHGSPISGVTFHFVAVRQSDFARGE